MSTSVSVCISSVLNVAATHLFKFPAKLIQWNFELQIWWEETQQLEEPPKEALQESHELTEQLAPPAGHRYELHLLSSESTAALHTIDVGFNWEGTKS